MSKILIAFSCGPDSVYLYHKLKKEGHDLGICYVNHNVRLDVDKDIEFVLNFSKKENLFYKIEDIKLDNFSEDKARELRYNILEKVRLENGFEYIATGHNKNDNVETIIFRMIRGTSLEGLKGIPKKRGNIIRPILDDKKEDILKYLEENNIEYRIDYTNHENKYSRNKIRNLIFPIMKDINENFLDNIDRLIENLNSDEFLKKEKISKRLKEFDVDISSNKIDEILSIENKNGKIINLNNKYVWYSSYNFFDILDRKEIEKKEFEKTILLNEKISINGYSIALLEYNKIYSYLEKKEYNIYNIKDIDKLIIRSRKNADYLDNKKLKDILIKLKVDSIKKNKIPIIDSNIGILAVGDLKYSKKITRDIKKNSNYLVIKKEDKSGE
ncbi:tRNA lysidine(34) synthetase TilS [Oceanivirga miroungae]|uniref:tRNA(Ile)-lysidine synthase n=1 Tax=Oceanivirga miroungae TaxID=1130046 RepID=A0A6I8MAL6_9FUSO|nr:tRNA lysidine(34) synthetase TilS [Oceanivirga miroungae]VWL85822.1 tRNA(Ile)-lysidine synthetase [Oceanivirga miroungae]